MRNESNNQIKKGVLISYLTLAINVIVSLIYTPWMVSIIGKSDYALYTLANSLISIFLVDFGLSSATSRFVAIYRAKNEKEKIQKLVSTIERVYVVISCILTVLFVILFFFVDTIYAGLTSDEISKFRIIYCILCVSSVTMFPFMPLTGILNAYEKFVQSKLCDLFQKMVAILIVVATVHLNYGVYMIVVASVISTVIFTIIKLLIINKDLNIKINIKGADNTLSKEVFKFTAWLTVIIFAQRSTFSIAPSLLASLSNSNEIAFFGPANSLESYFYSIAAAINGLFLARVSKYIEDGKEAQVFELMVKVGRYQFLILGCVFVVFFCAGKDFIVTWMGQDFEKSWLCSVLLFIPDILLSTQQIANTKAIAKGVVKEQAIGYVGMALVCIVSSVLLCGDYGAVGSCGAITIAYVFLFIYLNCLYRRKLNIDIIAFFKRSLGSMLLPFLSSLILGYFVCNFLVKEVGWSFVIIKCLMVTCLYAICHLLAMKKADRARFFYTLLKQIKK